MLKLKKRLAKVGVSFMLASALLFGAASFASAEVVPVSCSPSADGGMYVTYYDTVSGMYAVFLVN